MRVWTQALGIPSTHSHLFVAVEAGGIAEALLLPLVEEVLQWQALVVQVEATVVTAVGFQALGGTELGEAGVAADAVHHIPIADLVLDLQAKQNCGSPGLALASIPREQRCSTAPK